jgi:hypothetical protein
MPSGRRGRAPNSQAVNCGATGAGTGSGLQRVLQLAASLHLLFSTWRAKAATCRTRTDRVWRFRILTEFADTLCAYRAKQILPPGLHEPSAVRIAGMRFA